MNRSTGFYPSLAVVLFSLLMSSGVCFAGPGLLNYQGRLTDAKGNPVTYTVTITFTFWNAESGGEVLSGFSDSDTVTPDRDGIYSTLVGDDPDNLIPESVFERKAVWLNVNVNGEDLIPRKRLTSVGYSVQSETVRGAEVGRMSFKAAEDIKQGDVVVLTENGEIVPTRLPGMGEAVLLAPGSAHVFPDRILQIAADKALLFHRSENQPRVVPVSISGLEAIIDRAAEAPLPGSFQDAEALGDGRFIFSFVDVGKNECIAQIATIGTNGTISFIGSPVTIAVGNSQCSPRSDLAVLDSGRVLIAYFSGAGSVWESRAMVLSISGASLTTGTPVTLHSYYPQPGAYSFRCEKLDTDKAVITYVDAESATHRNHLAIVSGASITLGAGVSGPQTFWQLDEIVKIGVGKAVWMHPLSNDQVEICLLFAAGGSLSKSGGIPVPVSNNYSYYSLSRLRDGLALVVSGAKAYPVSASESVLTLGAAILYDDDSRMQTSIASAGIGQGKVMLAYVAQQGAVPHGYLGTFVRVINAEQGGIPRSYEQRVGVAEGAAQAGGECLVTIPGGVTKQFSGLIPGKDYFVTEKGISDTGVLRIGVALTPDKLLISR